MIGGTLNRTGLFRFKATRVGAETALAQIIKMVEDAQASSAADPAPRRPSDRAISCRRWWRRRS